MVIYQQRLKEFLIQGIGKLPFIGKLPIEAEAIPGIGQGKYQQLELQRYSPQPVQFCTYIYLQCFHSSFSDSENMLEPLGNTSLKLWTFFSVIHISSPLCTYFPQLSTSYLPMNTESAVFLYLPLQHIIILDQGTQKQV